MKNIDITVKLKYQYQYYTGKSVLLEIKMKKKKQTEFEVFQIREQFRLLIKINEARVCINSFNFKGVL